MVDDPPTPLRFNAVARTLHWLVAAGIVVQYVLAEIAEHAEEEQQRLTQLAVLANHKSVGITLLLLVVLRLLWRVASSTPAPAVLTTAMSTWQARAAQFTHYSLYALLLMLPVSGWLMSSATAYSVSWFNLVQLPDLVSPSERGKLFWTAVHHYAGKGLLVLAVLHILAALKHHFIDKDSVMARMANAPGLIAFALLSAGGVWALGSSQVPPQTATVQPAIAAPPPAVAPVAGESLSSTAPSSTAPAAWIIDYADSYIRFTATQAGASFQGEWQQWEADVLFATQNLANSRAEVRIQAANVSTGDTDRDATLASSDWFDSASFATVTFQTQQIQASPDGYQADATLSVRGISHPINFHFNIGTREDGAALLTGSSQLDRLELGLGLMEFSDTQWVGQEVSVDVRLAQSPAATPNR